MMMMNGDDKKAICPSRFFFLFVDTALWSNVVVSGGWQRIKNRKQKGKQQWLILLFDIRWIISGLISIRLFF
jgi:hypothetical protein